MSHIQSLNELRNRLRVDFNGSHRNDAVPWGNPHVMTEALRQIQREIGGDGIDIPDQNKLQKTLKSFARKSKVGSFNELKYVCYGITVPIGDDQWRIIDREPLFNALLGLVAGQSKYPKQFRRCYQGLLTSYFGFARNPEGLSEADHRWVTLRGYLASNLSPLVKVSSKRGPLPTWLDTLQQHKNLLTDQPCNRYASGLSKNDTSELKAVCSGLGIQGNSWVWDEALLAYIRLVCDAEESYFKGKLTSALSLINGQASLKLPFSLSVKATAMMVKRYAGCTEKPEHSGLRDTCLEWIGNPWLKKTAWDALVADEPARQMINSWLKQRLIRDFFELLAADGAADLRRLNYWLKLEAKITDMWFVLGSEARYNRTAAFKDLRKRMEGRYRYLIDNNVQNNAFVMRIGPLLVIEFGVTGNACYVFSAADFKADLDCMELDVNNDLKQKVHATRLTHQGTWEPKFDYELRRLLQSAPASRGELRSHDRNPSRSTPASQTASSPVNSKLEPSTGNPYAGLTQRPPWPFALTSKPKSNPTATPTAPGSSSSTRIQTQLAPGSVEFDQFKRLFAKHKVEWEDNRSKGGALWVLIPNKNQYPVVREMLSLYSFRFVEGKGYWLKD
jgi:hypothetical protein